MLLVQEEVSKLFLYFITKSTTSPHKNVKAVFYRRKYQWNSGNISHAHIILAVDFKKLSEEESVFVKRLGQGSVFDVIRSDKIDYFIANNTISSEYEVDNNVESSITFLT